MARCNKCGNFVNNGATVCPYCRAPLYNQWATPNGYSQGQSGGGTYGLGGAIASAIMGFFSFIFAFVSELLALDALNSYSTYYDYYGYYHFSYYDEEMAIAAMVFGFLAIGLAIPSIIMGAKSIGRFKYARQNLGSKPIGTLVVGIHGLVFGIMGVIFGCIGVFGAISCF